MNDYYDSDAVNIYDDGLRICGECGEDVLKHAHSYVNYGLCLRCEDQKRDNEYIDDREWE